MPRLKLSLAPVALAALAAGLLAVQAAVAAPSPSALLAQSAGALGGKRSVHYDVKLTITAETGPGASAQLGLLAGRPLTVDATGGVGPKIVTATVTTALLGGTPIKVVLAQKAGFVFLNGRWYGSKQLGRASLKTSSSLKVGGVPVSSATGALGSLNSLVKGTVSDGPTLPGGVETWKLTGSLDPEALAKQAASAGQSVKPADLAAVLAVAHSTTVTALVAKGDGLLRQLHVAVELTPKALAALSRTSSGAQLKGLKSLTLSVDATFSDWGKPVVAETPQKYAPLDQLLGALLGGAGALGTKG